MPWRDGTTIREAREILSEFLVETGCSQVCAHCPVVPGGEGCCDNCPTLARSANGKVLGCSQPNLSCLSHTCSVLSEHLRRLGRLEEFLGMIYGLPKEGRRGNQRRRDDEVVKISDPLTEIVAKVRILKDFGDEDPGSGNFHTMKEKTS